jgi:hypothetical protein
MKEFLTSNLHLSINFEASVLAGLFMAAWGLYAILTGNVTDENDNKHTKKEINILGAGLVIGGLFFMFNGLLGSLIVIFSMLLLKITGR